MDEERSLHNGGGARVSVIRGALLGLVWIFHLVCVAPPAVAVDLPDGFEMTLVVDGLAEPTAMEFSPDGRLFVSERRGHLRVVKNGELLAAAFFTKRVINNYDGRLIGVAFDPDFERNGYVYVNYKHSIEPYINRLSRVTANPANPDVSLPGSEAVILEYAAAPKSSHGGEAIHFGTDGRLYVAVGDTNIESTVQSLETLNGKMLRIDPSVCPDSVADGKTCAEVANIVPADNPFTDASQYPDARGEIWALGLRNPYTFSVDPVTGRMFINDVGEKSWEEINLGSRGANYGWPTCEGVCPGSNPGGFEDPFFAYDHDVGCAITSGAFYRGQTFPNEFEGSYFFADFCVDTIQRWKPDNHVGVFATETPGGLNNMKVGPDGALYLLSYDEEAVYRIQYTGDGNQTPHVAVSASPVSGPAPLTVRFNATGSSDPDGDPLVYTWDFGDGAPLENGETASHTYGDEGAYTARLTVEDPGGAQDTATVTISVGGPPVGRILHPAAGTLYRGGDSIHFEGTASDTEDGTLPPSAFSWTVQMHHHFENDPLHHFHPLLGPVGGLQEGTFEAPTTGESDDDVWLRILLTVTDSTGLQHESSRDIHPHLSTFTLATDPSGLQLTLDGQPRTAPYLSAGVVGMEHTLEAMSPQELDGREYRFGSWSDGSDAFHVITTQDSDTTYTASFEAAPVVSQESSVLPDANVAQEGDLDFPMLQFSLEAGSASNLLVQAVTVGASGSGTEVAAIARVLLYLDTNASGEVEAGDTLLSTAVFSSDNGSTDLVLRTAHRMVALTSDTFLVACDFENGLAAAAAPTVPYSKPWVVARLCGALLPVVLLLGLLGARHRRRVFQTILFATLCCVLGFACSGGSGGGGGGGVAPAPAASTFQLSVTSFTATEESTGDSTVVTGLPITGSTVTVD